MKDKKGVNAKKKKNRKRKERTVDGKWRNVKKG